MLHEPLSLLVGCNNNLFVIISNHDLNLIYCYIIDKLVDIIFCTAFL